MPPLPLPPFTSPVTTTIELLNIQIPCNNFNKFLWQIINMDKSIGKTTWIC